MGSILRALKASTLSKASMARLLPFTETETCAAFDQRVPASPRHAIQCRGSRLSLHDGVHRSAERVPWLACSGAVGGRGSHWARHCARRFASRSAPAHEDELEFGRT